MDADEQPGATWMDAWPGEPRGRPAPREDWDRRLDRVVRRQAPERVPTTDDPLRLLEELTTALSSLLVTPGDGATPPVTAAEVLARDLERIGELLRTLEPAPPRAADEADDA